MQEAVIREIQQLRLLMGSARDPRGRVFAQLADALRRNGELDEAWRVVRDGVEADPHFVPGHLVKGWVLQDRGELDGALDAYRQAVELDPENPFGLHGVGSLLRARGDDGGAELLERARELHPEVETSAPVAPAALVPLHELPFLSLAELAPEEPGAGEEPGATATDALHDLPFMSLAELAPAGSGESAAAGREEIVEPEGTEDLPFMSLADLAPDAVPEAEPVAEPVQAVEPVDEPDPPEGAEAVAAGDPGWPAAVEETGVAPEDTPDPAAEAVEAVGSGDGVEEDEDDDVTPATRTMAELLVSQNQVERAVDIYEDILRNDPDNRDVAARIQELREELHPELSGADAPAESGPSPFTWHEDDAGEDDGGGDEVHPTDGDADDGGSAARAGEETAAGYFGRLLSFTPGRGEGAPVRGPESEGESDDGGTSGIDP